MKHYFKIIIISFLFSFLSVLLTACGTQFNALTDDGNEYNTKDDSTETPLSEELDHEHVFGNWGIIKPATCCEEGKESRTCYCGFTETRTLDRLEHDYEEEITSANCTEPGYKIIKCRNCDHISSKIETEPMLEHQLTGYTDIEPTCTEPGKISFICDYCRETIKEKAIPANGHQYQEENQEQTCFKPGFHKEICSICGDEKYEELPQLSHEYDDTHNCIYCGQADESISEESEAIEEARKRIENLNNSWWKVNERTTDEVFLFFNDGKYQTYDSYNSNKNPRNPKGTYTVLEPNPEKTIYRLSLIDDNPTYSVTTDSYNNLLTYDITEPNPQLKGTIFSQYYNWTLTFVKYEVQ